MAWMQRLRKNKSLQYGLPMMVLIVGGSFGLREFAQVRYDIQKIRGKMDPELEKKFKKSKVTLEEEYEKIKIPHLMIGRTSEGPVHGKRLGLIKRSSSSSKLCLKVNNLTN